LLSPWYRSFMKALRWGCYITAHAGVTVVFIGAIYVI
jgi:hypothetical protein